MPSYLVETYLGRSQAGERTSRERRARAVMKELAREGTRVRFECSVYVPEDEICFFVFGAHSVRAAARAAERAGLDPLRIVEAVSTAGAHDTRRRRRNADVKEEQ